MAIALGTQQLIGDPLAMPGQRLTRVAELAAAVALLWVLTAAGEEMMFRGWMQTILTRDYGAWVGIGVAALLFGLRHVPMDVHAGLSQQAPPSAWISRMLQLCAGAAVFGVARHRARSTWASWITHEGFLLLIVLLGVVTAQGR
jgi:membrane protease YdiL (CAAX protease family)